MARLKLLGDPFVASRLFDPAHELVECGLLLARLPGCFMRSPVDIGDIRIGREAGEIPVRKFTPVPFAHIR